MQFLSPVFNLPFFKLMALILLHKKIDRIDVTEK